MWLPFFKMITSADAQEAAARTRTIAMGGAARRMAVMLATQRAEAFPMCSADVQRSTVRLTGRVRDNSGPKIFLFDWKKNKVYICNYIFKKL